MRQPSACASMSGVTTRTTYPVCAMDGCDQQIWLRPDMRTVCAACEMRGGPPPPKPPPPPRRTDEDRIRSYLKTMTPEKRQWSLDNLENFNTDMARQWRRIAAELD